MDSRMGEYELSKGNVFLWELKRIVPKFDEVGREEFLSVQTQRNSIDGQPCKKASRKVAEVELAVRIPMNG